MSSTRGDLTASNGQVVWTRYPAHFFSGIAIKEEIFLGEILRTNIASG
jgi:hypothetical protein